MQVADEYLMGKKNPKKQKSKIFSVTSLEKARPVSTN